jgi:hypothetical protein
MHNPTRPSLASFHPLLLLSLLAASTAASVQAQAPDAAAAPPPAPPPYSLPWQLRPVAAANVVRSDTTVAFYENPMSGESGSTVASMLLGSYKVTPDFAPLVRLGVVSASAPEGTMTPAGAIDSGFSFVNPVIGGTYVFKLSPEWKLGAFLGLTIPVGSGGGETPDIESAFANRAGILARSAMDNAMFAVNYFTVFPGLGLSWVAHGVTVQAEVTLLQLFRVRANEMVEPDNSRTNFTMGLHAGYFFIPQLSLGAELRHQRWLSTPAAVEADTTDTLRDNTTVAVGIRGHFKLNDTMWLRPGIAYARGLDDPMDLQKYNILQIDVPFVF